MNNLDAMNLSYEEMGFLDYEEDFINGNLEQWEIDKLVPEMLQEYLENTEEIMKEEKKNELIVALIQAKKEIGKVIKDKKNPFYNSRYADLTTVLNACVDPLAENGIVIIQTVEEKEPNPILITQLIHESGESISSSYPLILGKKDPQALGSAITYARRYSIMALVGISPEDDDGNAAMPKKTNKKLSLRELSKLLKDQVQIPKGDYLMDYLRFCESKVDKPMEEVVEGWMQNPSKFLDHYKKWTAKKEIVKNDNINYEEISSSVNE